MNHYESACFIVKQLKDQGYTAYFAGGWVRDHLLDFTSDDIDIATSATVDEIQQLFSKTIGVGIQFGIVIVVINDYQFEVATFRQDGIYEDGRRPQGYTKASAKEDAQRRDFTINGLFYDPVTEEVFDYIGGKDDIHRKVIRAIGDPNLRFEEDRLRILRAIRYACRFNFSIDHATLSALKTFADKLFPAVAVERVWQELKKMAAYPRFSTALTMLYDYHILQKILPISSLSKGQFSEIIASIEHVPKHLPLTLKLFPLLQSLEKEDVELFCMSFKLSNQELKELLCMQQLNQRYNSLGEDIETLKLFSYTDFEICLETLIAFKLDEKEQKAIEHIHIRLKNFIKRRRTKTPIVPAKELILLGIQPGPLLGHIMDKIEELAVKNHSEDKTLLLTLIQSDPSWPVP